MKKSRVFDEIIVLTDSKKIQKLSINYGAKCPFLRPKKLNKENVGVLDICKYFLNLKIINNIDNLCCTFPVSPLTFAKDYKKAIKLLLKDENIDFVFSASKNSHPIEKTLIIKNKKLKMKFGKKYYPISSKFLEDTYHDNGQFYLAKVNTWKRKKIIYSDNSKFINIPHWRGQDVDVIDDWIKTKLIFNQIKMRYIKV